MSQENASNVSPFAALSYQEQQDRWLEWRSRQLDYQPASQTEKPAREPDPAPRNESYPALRTPNMRIAAPTRHRELDEVLTRHRQATQKAGSFQAAPIG